MHIGTTLSTSVFFCFRFVSHSPAWTKASPYSAWSGCGCCCSHLWLCLPVVLKSHLIISAALRKMTRITASWDHQLTEQALRVASVDNPDSRNLMEGKKGQGRLLISKSWCTALFATQYELGHGGIKQLFMTIHLLSAGFHMVAWILLPQTWLLGYQQEYNGKLRWAGPMGPAIPCRCRP